MIKTRLTESNTIHLRAVDRAWIITLKIRHNRATNDGENTAANSTDGLSSNYYEEKIFPCTPDHTGPQMTSKTQRPIRRTVFRLLITRKTYFSCAPAHTIMMKIEVLRLLVALVNVYRFSYRHSSVCLLRQFPPWSTTTPLTWALEVLSHGAEDPAANGDIRRYLALPRCWSSSLSLDFGRRDARERKNEGKKHTADGAELVLATIIVQTDGPDYKITAYFSDHCSILLHQTSTLECFFFVDDSFFFLFVVQSGTHRVMVTKLMMVIKRFPD